MNCNYWCHFLQSIKVEYDRSLQSQRSKMVPAKLFLYQNYADPAIIAYTATETTTPPPTPRFYCCYLTTVPHIVPLPEDNVVQVEGILDDAGGGHSGPQDVLLRGQVVGVSHPVNVRQKAGK
jgi:hypothetical protein